MTRELQGDTAIDFRLERLRRAWLKGRTPAALAVAQHFASAGLAEAQYLLGQMLSPTGAPEDAEKAKHGYRAASDQGHAAATKALWWMTANDGGEDAWERALVFAQRAAELGDDAASRMLVYTHEPDSQIPNLLKYLRRHADLGDALAQLRLGQAYYKGRHGAARDAQKAFELFLLSARQGNSHAQFCVGMLYQLGQGVPQNDEQAVHWFREAARRGSALAQGSLGSSYAIGRAPLKQSMQEANRWYRRAALRDDRDAQYMLGRSYLDGTGLPQNYELASRWFARSAQQGHPGAQFDLGFLYWSGLGVAVSHSRAAELYLAAARAGLAVAKQNYGCMLQNGFSVEKDLPEAVRWYRAAAEQGLASSQSCLAWMYENGVGVNKNLDEALRLYRLAAAQGDEHGIKGVERCSSELQACTAHPSTSTS